MTRISTPRLSADLDLLFKGFADPTRIRILNVLAAGELCVCDIVALLGVAQPTISRHLAYLRRTGLVRARPDLKFTYYQLTAARGAVHRNLIDCVRTSFRRLAPLNDERELAEVRVAYRKASPCG